MKKIIALLLALCLVMSLAACGAKQEAATPATEPAPATEAATEPATEAATEPATEAATEAPEWPKTITDVMGNELTLEGPASKLVGTHNPTMNVAVILGGGGKYIAGFGNKEMADVLYSYVYPELKDDVIQIGKGKNVNYETVLTTGADLAILPERFAYMVEEFNAIDIPAIVILTSKENYDTIRNALTLMGQVTGEEDRAEEIIAYFDDIIDKITERTATVETKPSVMFLGSSNMYSVAPGAMIQSDIMETAGAVNAVSGVDVLGSFADVSAEEIVGWNPDVIWIPAYADYTVEDVLNAPEFSSITAVQNGAVYSFPSTLEPWDYPSASACLGAAWAAYNLHPEVYSYDELITDINGLYDLLYGQTFTAEQIGIVE